MNVTRDVMRYFGRESRQTFGRLTIPNLSYRDKYSRSLRERFER